MEFAFFSAEADFGAFLRGALFLEPPNEKMGLIPSKHIVLFTLHKLIQDEADNGRYIFTFYTHKLLMSHYFMAPCVLGAAVL